MFCTRVVTQEGNRLALQFWIGVTAALVLAASVAVGGTLGATAFQTGLPGIYEIGLIIGMGALVALTHWMISQALARAEAGLLAPLQYLEIIAATLIGWIIFGDFPDAITWLGTTIIVGAGAYVFYRVSDTSTTSRSDRTAP